MQPQEQKRSGDFLTTRDSFNNVHFLVRSLATCVTVFTRHTFGQEALEWNGIGAVAVILLYGTAEHAPEMFGFLVIWLVALVGQRIRTFWAIAHGLKLHSRDGGYLWLGYAPVFVKKYRYAIVVEFAVCFLVGMMLRDMSRPLGSFIVVAAWSTLIAGVIDIWALKMEARRMGDAEIEMRTRVEIYQGKNNDF